MNYGNIKTYDIANGPGVRVSLFVSGCRLHCKNCFNKDAQNFNYGKPLTEEVVEFLIQEIKKPEIQGLTILGGEPFEPENQSTIAYLLARIQNAVQDPHKTYWIYSGYTLETLPDTPNLHFILECIDVLVDGPFVEELKNPMLAFRGSSNQRIINMRKYIEIGKIVTYIDENFRE